MDQTILPVVMNELAAHRDGQPAGTRDVEYWQLKTALIAKGHSSVTAEWEIHRHVEAGRLTVSPGRVDFPSAIDPSGPVCVGGHGWSDEKGRSHIGWTNELEEWWRGCYSNAPSQVVSQGKDSSSDTGKKQRGQRISIGEAEIHVREYLKKHAKENPGEITRDAVAQATGVSRGTVSNTKAWKAFRERRDAEAKPSGREVPLSDKMQAFIPAKSIDPKEVDEVIAEQAADTAEQDRRQKRRHEPS